MTNFLRLRLLALIVVMTAALGVSAQRKTDRIGRGIVAVPTGSTTNHVSWRRLAEEYYGVTYNLYKDGALLASGLTKTSYIDNKNGNTGSSYQVAAVVNGEEQNICDAVTPWSQFRYQLNGISSGFIDLAMSPVYDRDGNLVTSHYEPNDAEFADLDGDGDLEMIIKRINTADVRGVFSGKFTNSGDSIFNMYPRSSKEFVVLDAYDVDWQTGATNLWWRIDCGPNMVSHMSTEINIIAYDWDEDGKAEVILRGADNMIIYGNDGWTHIRDIGNMSVNTRQVWYNKRESDGKDISSMAYTNTGAEYLIYMEGKSGKPYSVTDYPLTRGSADAWGYGSGSPTNDSYGHRSSKYFFGAPVFDGRKASLFMARGIYGRHWMKAFDINPSSHIMTEIWDWECNDHNSAWYGNGYHNYIVADVDEDGRDEIVYGSMVIDDNGNGLSTTGLGHGDAQHVSDFDPYRRGLEFFGCNEDNPGMNYRNATTSEIYYRATAASDDGRGIMDNFTNNYPGSVGTSVSSDVISSVTDQVVFTSPTDTRAALYWSNLNFRIYWDGDLCSEVLNSPGTGKEAAVIDADAGRLFTSPGGNLNNGSKNNPCFSGDLIGDWREEIVMRFGQNVRIYTTGIATDYDVPTLWHDHQYRQAMVWQMMAYNQPPHVSFFLGETEDYTVAPPPLTLTDREVVSNGGTIGTALNGKHVLMHGYDNMSATVASGAQPSVITVNAPSWTQGHDNNNNITTAYYTHTLGGAALSGATALTKQGLGVLTLSANTHTHTGATHVWGGTLNFDGEMTASPVTLHRHTTLNSSGGVFPAGITMEYGATLNVGGATSGEVGTVSVGELNMKYGSRVVVDLNGAADNEHDWLNADKLIIDDSKVGQEVWEQHGPQYIVPVIELHFGHALPAGMYPLGNVAAVEGDLERVVVESTGLAATSFTLVHQNGKLYINVGGVKEANEPTFAITGMNMHDLSSLLPTVYGSKFSYLPVVSVIRTTTDGITPTLSATFTSLSGEVTDLGIEGDSSIMTEDYTSATGTGDWTIGCASYLKTGDATYGNYINIASENSGGNRRSYKNFYAKGSDFYGDAEEYTVEFDALFHRTNDGNNLNELVLFGEGATMPAVNSYFNSTGSNYLFRITGGNNNANYAVEGSSATANIGDKWCHYTITVNREERTVSYEVRNGSTVVLHGTYEANSGADMRVQGIGITLGRAWSYAYIDNIHVEAAAVDLSTYAFTQPGTYTVTAYVGEGYAPVSASYQVDTPYKKLYESADYDQIAVEDAPTALGSDYWLVGDNINVDARGWTRFANWANITYTFAINKVNSPSQTIYVDKDKQLWVDYTNSSQALHLLGGYGLGQSGGATFHAAGMGDESAIIYHRYDLSLGNAANILEEYLPGKADGSYVYGKTNGTLQKFIAYVPLKAIWGDLNHDGNVTVSDVTVLVNYILGHDDGSVVPSEADLNEDGSPSVSDVTILVNFLMGYN